MPRPQDQRPLSPFMLGPYYRFQMSSALSILHRITGFALALGLILFAAWLTAAAYSPECFEQIQELASSIVGKLFLFGWTVAFYYHFANGLRHLNWDLGRGFKLDEMAASGWVVIAFTFSMTVLTWIIVWKKLGALV